jgi:glycosyltransferase involved in cell wall biosynthesis
MDDFFGKATCKLSIVIPCYNEEKTIKECVERVFKISDANLLLELIIVDDHSTDNSYSIARELKKKHPTIIKIIRHKQNSGKGAALRSGFKMATGDFVAVQDADLEYDPNDLKRLIVPLIEDKADVVLGSRFLSTSAHRVLYFWHSLGNRLLTFLSNMFTDLNLTDMETCYKVFRRDIIQRIDIKEDRFGFEPEIVAKLAQMRLRIYEMGISYYGRTYAEGKKIGIKDGLRALYCIFRYNAHKAPIPTQIFLYLIIGGFSAFVNLVLFLIFISSGIGVTMSAPIAFIAAAFINYLLCIAVLFRHKAKWSFKIEILIYIIIVAVAGLMDLGITVFFISLKTSPGIAKIIATVSIFILNFTGRRFIVFPEPPTGPWRPQYSSLKNNPIQSENQNEE